MSRDQRELELKKLAEQDKSQFAGIYKRSVRILEEQEGPTQMRMIELILDHEFPPHAPEGHSVSAGS